MPRRSGASLVVEVECCVRTLSGAACPIRNRWGWRKGNDKRTRVGVTVSALPDPSQRGDAHPSNGTDGEAFPATDGETSALRVKVSELEAELRVRTVELEAERRRSDELRSERDDWKAQAQALALPSSSRWRWWRRLTLRVAPPKKPQSTGDVFEALTKHGAPVEPPAPLQRGEDPA